MTNEEMILELNKKWLELLEDLEDLATFLEMKDMTENAKTIRFARELLISWNPRRRESFEKVSE